MTDDTRHRSPNTIKTVWIVIALLVVTNVAVLSYLFVTRGHPHPPGFPPQPERGGGPFLFIVHETRMTNEQQRQYEELRDKHHERIEQLRENTKDLRVELYGIGAQRSEQDTRQLMEKIAHLQFEIDSTTFHHFKEVRAVLNPEQQKIFDSILPEAVRMMSPRPGPPPPRDGVGRDDRPPPPEGLGPPPERDEAPHRRPPPRR